MGDRIGALEAQVGNVTTTLQELVLQMQNHAQQMQQQSLILTKLSKQVGKKVVTQEENSEGNSSQSESRLAGKKVKLPLFEGDDPVAWITRAEIYFDVQNTSDDMRVKLARLSMEGATIH